MTCGCATLSTDSAFTARTARREARRYRRKGPTGTTKILLEGLAERDARGDAMLDIGGGVGVLHHELLEARFQRALHVDAANAYIDVARSEASARGHIDQVEFRFGDAVELADDLTEADLVTLDRVVCCYPDEVALLDMASGRARRWLALSYPRNLPLMRVGVAVLNLYMYVLRKGFRAFVRPEESIRQLIRDRGFEPVFEQQSALWQVTVFERSRV